MRVGDRLPLRFSTRDTSGAAADAGAVTLAVGLPDGTVITPAVEHPGVGQYTAAVLAEQPGRHSVRWTATGTNPGAFSDVLNVDPPDTLAIIGLDDARWAANLDAVTGTEVELWPMVAAASRVVERHTGQVIVRRRITEHATARRWGVLLRAVPVIALISVSTVDGEHTWDVADLLVDPSTGLITARTGPELFGELVIVLDAGHPVIPPHYIEATKIIVAHMWKTQRRPTNVRVGFDSEPAAYDPGMGFALPNRALELLGSPRTGIA